MHQSDIIKAIPPPDSDRSIGAGTVIRRRQHESRHGWRRPRITRGYATQSRLAEAKEYVFAIKPLEVIGQNIPGVVVAAVCFFT